MLEYTKVVLNQTIDDIKKLDMIASFVTQGVYISYLIYAIIARTGILYVNIPLLAISLAYLVFSIIMERKKKNKSLEKIKNKAKESYKIAKYIILIPALISAIITLATLDSDNITFSFLFTVLMIFTYMTSILLSVITKVVEQRLAMFEVAIKADFEPIVNAYNTIRKFKGERVEDSAPDKSEQKMRADLDKKVDKVREATKEKIPKATMSKEELKNVRKEIITSVASNIADKAKQKIKSLASKLPKISFSQSSKPSADADILPLSEATDALDDKEPIEK
jgi:hypothetical protein